MSVVVKIPADDWDYLRWNSYFSNRHNLLYVSTPKAACTTLKWWFADLVGLRQRTQDAKGSCESTPDGVIHDLFARVSAEHTGLAVARLEQIVADPGVFRFCVVRNPFTRTFSAWQSKWLLRETPQAKAHGHAAFMKRSPMDSEGVARALEDFLEGIVATEHPVIKDVHLKPQRDLLHPEAMDYSVVGRLESPDAFLSRLERHLGSEFNDPFRGERRNEGLIPYHPRFVSPRAADLIRQMYHADFDHFGYPANAPAGSRDVDDGSIAAILQAVPAIQARNERIGRIIAESSESIEQLRRDLDRALCEREQALLREVNLPQRVDRVVALLASGDVDSDTIRRTVLG